MPTNGVFVHPSMPLRSIALLIGFGSAKREKLSGPGGAPSTSPQLRMEWIKGQMKLDIVHVPYSNPGWGAMDVIAVQPPVNIANFPLRVALVMAVRLRVLSVAHAGRQALQPDAPTLREAGVPDIEVASWMGVYPPSASPVAALDKTHADTTAVLRAPDAENRLAELDMPVIAPFEG